MKDKNDLDLSELPQGYWIENASDPLIIGFMAGKKRLFYSRNIFLAFNL